MTKKPTTESNKKSVFEYVNSVTYKKQYIWDDFSDKEYCPFVVNRAMSYYIDTVLLAAQINLNTKLEYKMGYDYYFNAVRPRKRYSKWARPDPVSDKIALIQKYYGYNMERAKTALKLLTDDQIEQIQRYFD